MIEGISHMQHLLGMGVTALAVGLLCAFQAYGFLTTLIWIGTGILILEFTVYLFAILDQPRIKT